jgi:MoCo/4Fe-4S cofactor protein with predicted Tat translocation signal
MSGDRWWCSPAELAETGAAREARDREFPEGYFDDPDPVSRREFLKALGASVAVAGLAGCGARQPKETIVPYVRQPEEIVPGRPLFFATAMTVSGYGLGVLVESHEGRPTKIEGNPDHPASLGATDAFAQAAVFGLYDPDRSPVLTHRGRIST